MRIRIGALALASSACTAGAIDSGPWTDHEGIALTDGDSSAGAGRLAGGNGPLAAIEDTHPQAALLLVCQEPDLDECCVDVDLIQGTAADDTIKPKSPGATESRCILGEDGNDTIKKTFAGDFAWGGNGDDRLDGGKAADVLHGNDGSDNLKGKQDDDALAGGDGNDQLRGGPGDDVLVGGAGDDELDGGPGADVIAPGVGLDDVKAGPGDDIIVISGACSLVAGERIDGGDHHDTLVSPLDENELLALGVILDGIEEVVPPDDGLAGGCHGGGALLSACECCDGVGLDPGSGCTSCADGFISIVPHVEGDNVPPRVEPEICAPTPTCASIDCGDHGACDTFNGVASCVCEPGYTGTSCQRCAVGFERAGATCQPSAECAQEFCHGHGACAVDHQGNLVCECDLGFAGPNCGPAPSQLEATKPSVRSGSQLGLAIPAGADCPGGTFQWTTSAGTLEVLLTGEGATLTAPVLLPDDAISMVQVTATCPTAAERSLDTTISVTRSYDVWGFDGAPFDELEPFDEAMLEYLDYFLIQTGATLAVLKDTELVYLRSYGTRGAASDSPITPCTPMRLASVSKSFARAVFRAVEAGSATISVGGAAVAVQQDLDVTKLDDFTSTFGWQSIGACPAPNPASVTCYTTSKIVPASRYDVGEWPQHPLSASPSPASLLGFADSRFNAASIWHLMGHDSGLLSNDRDEHPDLPDPWGDLVTLGNDLELQQQPTYVDVVQYAVGASLQFPPQTPLGDPPGFVKYSNVGYTLLGLVVEWATGQPYFQALVSQLVNPAAPVGLGLLLGSDPQAGDLILHVAEGSQSAVDPNEPLYFSRSGSFPDQNTLTLTGSGWETQGSAPGPYSFDLAVTGAATNLVANAAVLAEFLRVRRVDFGTTYSTALGPDGGGLQVGGLLGTRALLWQLPHSEYPPKELNASGAVRTCASTADCILPVYSCVLGECTLDPDKAAVFYESPCPGEAPGGGQIPSGVAIAVIMAEQPEGHNPSDPTAGTCGEDPSREFEWDWEWLVHRLANAVAEVESNNAWPGMALTNAQRRTDCTLCGNGIVDTDFGEQCEDNEILGSCVGQGFTGGEIACSSECQLDTSNCTLCGDGDIEGDEQCEGTDFDGETCASLGFDGPGTLSCTDTCEIDPIDCSVCGNGKKEIGEECDDGNMDDTDACTNSCQANTGDPAPPVCLTDIGDHGCECHDQPLTPGQATYDRLRYCNSENYICRPFEPGEPTTDWFCFDCARVGDDGFDGQGCPCNTAVGMDCPVENPNLECAGFDETAQGSEPNGACWDGIPAGFCEKNCSVCPGHVCTGKFDQLVTEPTICASEPCFAAGGGGLGIPCEYTFQACRENDGTCIDLCEDDCDCATGELTCVAPGTPQAMCQ